MYSLFNYPSLPVVALVDELEELLRVFDALSVRVRWTPVLLLLCWAPPLPSRSLHRKLPKAGLSTCPLPNWSLENVFSFLY